MGHDPELKVRQKEVRTEEGPGRDGQKTCKALHCCCPAASQMERLLLVKHLPPALQIKEESGWSIPLRGSAEENYAEALEELNAFFLHPNKELYRLMEALGPASGWQGTFKSDSSARAAEEKEGLLSSEGSGPDDV